MTFTSCDRHHIWSLQVPLREVYPKIHSRFPLFEPHHAVPPIRQLIDAIKPVCRVASTGGRIGSTSPRGQGEFLVILKNESITKNSMFLGLLLMLARWTNRMADVSLRCQYWLHLRMPPRYRPDSSEPSLANRVDYKPINGCDSTRISVPS